MYDVIVIGAGPSGCTAALFSRRYGLKTLVLSDPGSLSQAEEASMVDDWPGTKEMAGIELNNRFKEHAKRYGAEFRLEKVVSITRGGKKFSVKTEEKTYEAGAVIFATGAKHRKAMVKGEEQFSGRGVSYCASCDGPLYKGKNVLVVGGGDTAVNSAMMLKNMGAKVTLVHSKEELNANRANQKRMEDMGVKTILNSVLMEIKGDKFVNSAVLMDTMTRQKKEVKSEGIFISIGSVPTSELAKGLGVKLNDSGYIVTDLEQRTNVEGVFASGDCTERNVKKIVAAAGYGAVAATSAYNWLRNR